MDLFSRRPNVKKLEKQKDVDALLALLDQNDLSIKRAAVKALGRIGDTRAVSKLISMINSPKYMPSSEIALWGDVAWALGEIGDPQSAGALKELRKTELGSSIGVGGDFEEMMRIAAEAKKSMDNLKANVEEALMKIGK